MRYADDKFTHVRFISGCQWMGNDTQEQLSPIYDGTGEGVSSQGRQNFPDLTETLDKRLT
jgi:hypothetical protein